MRVGVFHGSAYYLRYYYSALKELVDRGHELVLIRPETKTNAVRVPKVLRDTPVETALYPSRRGGEVDRVAKVLRLARDVVRFETPPLSAAYANRRRAHRHFLAALSRGGGAWSGPPLRLDEGALAGIASMLDTLHALVPPNERLVEFLRAQRLDAAVCISRVNFGGKEAEIVAAARAAGVPSAIVVYSWDNLSSKALIHEPPDRLFVWNDVQVDEAETLHGLDRDRVVATGAPRFDRFFALRPSAPRDELLRGLELDPAQATVLFLGSSGFVSKREPQIVERWIDALRASPNERVAAANVILRPHPGAFDEPHWVGWEPSDERVVLPPIRKKDRDLYDHIAAADAAVGLNTSAEIEAAIVGRPVLTFAGGDDAPGQEGSTHFRYLLAEEGGFAEHAHTLEQHVEQLARALDTDPHAEGRRRFLERFVRPRGLDRPAGPVLADEIERLARGDGQRLG